MNIIKYEIVLYWRKADEGTYVANIFTTSCYNGPFRCTDCESQSAFQYCYGKETDCSLPFPGNPSNFATKCMITVVR